MASIPPLVLEKLSMMQVEVLSVFGFSIFILYHQIYNTIRRAFAKVGLLPIRRHTIVNASLLIHIFVGLLEIIRYHILALSGHPVHANGLDFVFMLIHVITSYHLAKEKGRIGNKSIIRPIYHSQALFRVIFTSLAYLGGLPEFHRASVKINVSFIYPRLLLFAGCRLGLLDTYGEMYTISMFASSLLALHDSGVMLGPQMWLASFAGFVVLERWVAQEVAKRDFGSEDQAGTREAEDQRSKRSGATALSIQDLIIDLLHSCGFVEVDTLKRGGKPPAPVIKIPGW
ncbi:hypothetical protein BJ170DRAFT_70776 [Xylariales sp. AK1849]|nr:hypothetical protein BJ170DRAFT_70776 [Xylariales sp. AK1849]